MFGEKQQQKRAITGTCEVITSIVTNGQTRKSYTQYIIVLIFVLSGEQDQY